MSKILLVLLVTIVCQTFVAKGSKECYDRECPNLTTGCKKEIKTSDDKKTLSTTIYCLDAEGMVVKQFSESKENPFGPGTTFQSTSYSSTYISNGSGPVDINIHNNINPINDNNIEDFAKK